MLNEQVREYIAGLGDAELVEYVLTGQRMYEADAVAFAREELGRRKLPAEQLAALREPVDVKLAVAQLRGVSGSVRNTKLDGFVCDRCGVEAQTRFVEYSQNIGMLFMRQSRHYEGAFCRSCSSSLFWNTTMTTLFLGWWGFISMLVTPVFLIANLISYLRARSLPPVPEGASRPPQIDAIGVGKVNAYVDVIDARMAEGIDVHDIARELAPQAGLTPAQTWCGILAILHSRTQSLPMANEVAQGFPVVMNNGAPRR